ncbi:MAG: Ig-like domain-containing protein, partial [Clostridia bacterium]|nr:Ig-like domain-containing protein [Clostridia bacterium]
CEMCVDCAVETGLHCPSCEACNADVTICTECGEACSDCADSWCDSCEMCTECAIDRCNHCEECGSCFTDVAQCQFCDLCEDCCIANSASVGCGHMCIHNPGFGSHWATEHAGTAHTHHLTFFTAQNATCTTAGCKGYYTCFCGKAFEDSACSIQITNLNAWKAVGGNGYIAPKGHVEGEWKETKPATTTSEGVRTLYCSVCHQVIRTESIPKLNPTTPKVKSVSIEDLSLKYKATAKLNPSIEADSGAKYTVKYESSNTKVATVDENGNVTVTKRGKGTATITCTVTDEYGNTVTDTCKVSVKLSFGQSLVGHIMVVHILTVYILFYWIWH